MIKVKSKNEKDEISKSKKRKQADKIIKKHILWSMGAGIIPLPYLDVVGVSAFQLDMLHQLCKLYDIDYDANQGKNILAALTGGSLSRIGSNLLKTIPVIGSFLGTVSMIGFSGATTYAIGQIFISNFEDGVGLFEINLESGEKLFQDAYERGKEYVDSMKNE
jgi:uncharacterized protein (DUF697 family)